jgi:hypothetical protein
MKEALIERGLKWGSDFTRSVSGNSVSILLLSLIMGMIQFRIYRDHMPKPIMHMQTIDQWSNNLT